MRVAFQCISAIQTLLARLLDWSPFTLPILAEGRRYDRQKLRADAFAGLTIAIMSLPQAIGFALVAGLPPQMVVTSLLVGGFFAALFNSSHHTIFGPTNTVSVFLAAIIHRAATPALSPAQVAVLIGLLIGVIQLIAGLARLGNLTQFVSRSVILGYSAGVAVVIFLSQLPNLFGLAIAGDSRPIFSLWHLAVSLAPAVAIGRRSRSAWPASPCSSPFVAGDRCGPRASSCWRSPRWRVSPSTGTNSACARWRTSARSTRAGLLSRASLSAPTRFAPFLAS